MFAYGLLLCVGSAGVFLWVQIPSSSKDTELEPILRASFEHITSLKPYLQSQSHPEVLGVKASTFKVGGERQGPHISHSCAVRVFLWKNSHSKGSTSLPVAHLWLVENPPLPWQIQRHHSPSLQLATPYCGFLRHDSDISPR